MRRPNRRFRYTRRLPWERPFKPRGPLLPGRSLNPRVQRELRRANHLMAMGEHANAATIFVTIAEKARDLGIVYPAPMLFMQAAHAFLLGEQVDPSIEQARTGLEMLAAQERWRALKREGERYIQLLGAEGHKEQAQSLRTWLDGALKGQALEAPTANGELPEKCPYCGASMSMEQINAGGGRAAECHYCGSVVLPRNDE